MGLNSSAVGASQTHMLSKRRAGTIPNALVTFSSNVSRNMGYLSPTVAVTDANGVATVKFYSLTRNEQCHDYAQCQGCRCRDRNDHHHREVMNPGCGTACLQAVRGRGQQVGRATHPLYQGRVRHLSSPPRNRRPASELMRAFLNGPSNMRIVATAVCLACVSIAAPSYGQVMFFDDFNGPGLNPVYQAALPDAAWRGNQFPNFAYGNVATYRGGPDYSFETLDGASVLHLRNWIPNTSRRGVSTSTVFAADKKVRLEVRFNTLVQSPVTAWDELLELWVLDSSDLNRYDVVTIMGIGLGEERQFSAWSSISGKWVDTGHDTSESGFPFLDNNWYRMVIAGSPSQEVRASIYVDDGKTELIGFNLGHDLSVYSAGFKIGFSQSQGSLDAFSDSAIDWLRLSVVPEPALLTFYNNSLGTAAMGRPMRLTIMRSPRTSGIPARQQGYIRQLHKLSKGINGLMIDVYGLPGTPTVNDFLFRWETTMSPMATT